MVNTHELLIVTVGFRILFGTRIIYDVQENYKENLLHTQAFPAGVRHVLAGWVRLKEWITSLLFHHFLVAEKSYEKELGFIGKRFSAIENKAQLPDWFRRTPNPEKLKLIFTGTLAENTGVFRAIDLAKKLHAIEPKIELELIGYCAQRSTLQRLYQAVKPYPFIHLKGGAQLVPHREVFEAIATANFGLISYPTLHYLQNKMPTKLYEYLACQLPILLQNNKPWADLITQFGGGIVLDFEDNDPQDILLQMRGGSFYMDKSQSRERLIWVGEEMAFIRSVVG